MAILHLDEVGQLLSQVRLVVGPFFGRGGPFPLDGQCPVILRCTGLWDWTCVVPWRGSDPGASDLFARTFPEPIVQVLHARWKDARFSPVRLMPEKVRLNIWGSTSAADNPIRLMSVTTVSRSSAPGRSKSNHKTSPFSVVTVFRRSAHSCTRSKDPVHGSSGKPLADLQAFRDGQSGCRRQTTNLYSFR